MVEKLIYGTKSQVVFLNSDEKNEAIKYLATSSNIKMVLEDNDEQGAWSKEYRFIFIKEEGIPDCLKRNMTAGNKSYYGRINCKELYEEVNNYKKSNGLL